MQPTTYTPPPADLGSSQPLDADLTAIAGLDSAQSGVIASDGSGWFRKGYSALKTALGLTKSDVGLGNVDNTSDANKPVSTATQTALDGKQAADSDLTTIAAINAATGSGVLASDGSGWIYKSYAAVKTALSLTKADVGLGNVDNTSDTGKPVSTAQQTALDGKIDKSTLDANTVLYATANDTPAALSMGASTILARLASGNIVAASVSQIKTLLGLAISDTSGLQTALDAKQDLDSDLTAIAALSPTNDDVVQRKAGAWTNRTPAQLKSDLVLVKADVGLGNVDNTSDANKAVSTATQTALDARITAAYLGERLFANGGESPQGLPAFDNANVSHGAGTLKLMYFTALRSETITQIRARMGNAAFSSPTLMRFGIYSIAANGDGTLLVASASSTTGAGSTDTTITHTLSSSWSKVAGTRYAIGFLCVASAGNANMNGGFLANSAWSNLSGTRQVGNITSQSDLPSSFTAGSVADSASMLALVALP